LNEVRIGVCSRLDGGVPQTLWPFRDLEPSHGAFEAANLLASTGLMPVGREEVDFRSSEAVTDDWRTKLIATTLSRKKITPETAPKPPDGKMTRGEFARAWWNEVKDLPDAR
jgi:hypothetical protein